MRLKVTYIGEIDTELDDNIRKAMENIGAEWYGQGLELSSGIRDICFDINPPAKGE